MKTSNSTHGARNCLLCEGRDISEIPVSCRAVSVHLCVYAFTSSRARDGKCAMGTTWLNRLWWQLMCSLLFVNEVVRMTDLWRIPTSTSHEGPISRLLVSLSVLINLIFQATIYPILRWGQLCISRSEVLLLQAVAVRENSTEIKTKCWFLASWISRGSTNCPASLLA